jgi:RNA recognition motif-containing protein
MLSGTLSLAESSPFLAVAPRLYGVGMSCGDLATVHTLSSKDPSMNIFVGNLAFTTTEQDLRTLFEPYGTVETIRIMNDRETGRSRGFGFVEMPDSRAAADAIDALNGTSLAGRALTVNEARPREPRREPRQPRW